MLYVIIWLLLNAVILIFNFGAHKRVSPKKDEQNKNIDEKKENNVG